MNGGQGEGKADGWKWEGGVARDRGTLLFCRYVGVCTSDAENWDAKAGEGAAAVSMVSRDSKSCWTGSRDVSSGLEHPHIGHGRRNCSCGSGVTSLTGFKTGSPSHGLGSGAVEKDASSLKVVSVEPGVPGLGASNADVGRR